MSNTRQNFTKIGLGLAALGRPEYINIKTKNIEDKSQSAFKQNAFSVLDAAYDHGVRYFDTAPSYGHGEQFLQEWNALKNQSDINLGTKWGYTYVANWELGYEGKHEIKEHSLEKLNEQWETSKNLLPNLKFYQVHSATFESGILTNKNVLERLHQIKELYNLHIGISTSGANQAQVIEAALKIKIEDEFLFNSFQVTYNILEQSAHDILQQILQDQKTVIVKEALANGRIFENKNFPHYQELYRVLTKLSNKYNVGVDAIALRFVMDNLAPNYVLSGALSSSHLMQNLKAKNFNLNENELALLQSLKIDSEKYWDERQHLDWN